MAEDNLPYVEEDTEPSLIEQVALVNKDLLAYLRARQEAYRRFYAGKPIGDDLKIVMDDFKRFCFGGSTTYDEDARTHALKTGRQEYWLRVHDQLDLSFDELVAKYTKQVQPKEAR